MSLHLVNYQKIYRQDVLKCIRRNFKWLNQLNDEDLGSWFDSICDYSWSDRHELETMPFYHGAVVLDDSNSVVGYLGLIYSNRYINNYKVTELNTTTWVIDDVGGDRLFVFKATREILNNSFYITDLSAIPSAVAINKRFGLQTLDTVRYVFHKKYGLKKEDIKGSLCRAQNDINDDIVKREFFDHVKYGIRCYEFTDNKNRLLYIFYKMEKRNFFGIYKKWALILKVSDIDIFSENLEAIFNSIMMLEKTKVIKCDSHFINTSCSINTDKESITMMARLPNDVSSNNLDYLYSEIAMADMYAGSDVTISTVFDKIRQKITKK